jgi:predicted metal-binding membrane protein
MKSRKNKSFLKRHSHNQLEKTVLALGLIESGLFLLGTIWAFLNSDSLGGVLAVFIWYACIPFVVTSCLLSLATIRTLGEATSAYRIFFLINWGVVVSLLVNISD